MRTVAIGSKALALIQTGRAAGDQVQNTIGHNAAQNLRQDVGQALIGRETATRPQTDGDSRVQATTRDVTPGKAMVNTVRPKTHPADQCPPAEMQRPKQRCRNHPAPTGASGTLTALQNQWQR